MGPPATPTPAAVEAPRLQKSSAERRQRRRTNGGSFVEVAAAMGSAQRAKKAKTVIQILGVDGSGW